MRELSFKSASASNGSQATNWDDPALNRSSTVEIREELKTFLSEYVLLLHRSLPDLRVADASHIVTATTNLLAACLSPSPDHAVEAQRTSNAVNLERATRIINEKLADRNLTPDKLCRELGVSRSSLYRAFEPVGGISNYIRRKRLLRTRDILADSSDHRTIADVAEALGFIDPSGYSRMFRKEFGISPREAREQGRRGREREILPTIDRSIDAPHPLSSMLLRNQ